MAILRLIPFKQPPLAPVRRRQVDARSMPDGMHEHLPADALDHVRPRHPRQAPPLQPPAANRAGSRRAEVPGESILQQSCPRVNGTPDCDGNGNPAQQFFTGTAVPSAVAFIQWENYRPSTGGPGYFDVSPLTFNSHQPRLHSLAPGDRLWLVSRCPEDQQYYFVGALRVAALKSNAAGSTEAQQFGEFAIVADKSQSHDLGMAFPAEGILRALQFESKKPIKHGASIGQSLQTIRLLSDLDERLLNVALSRVLSGEDPLIDQPFGLWAKCDAVFANYFLANWTARREPLAFLLYDPPPALPAGSPVFIHSDKYLRIVARFRRSLYLAGHKLTVDADERIAIREWVWSKYRAPTITPPSKSDYDTFWDSQNGIRSLFLMDELIEAPVASAFKEYGRALEWGYPMGVGYRYVTLSQSCLLLACAGLAKEARGEALARFMGQPRA